MIENYGINNDGLVYQKTSPISHTTDNTSTIDMILMEN